MPSISRGEAHQTTRLLTSPKVHPPHSCSEGGSCPWSQETFLYQAVNMLFNAVKFAVLSWKTVHFKSSSIKIAHSVLSEQWQNVNYN